MGGDPLPPADSPLMLFLGSVLLGFEVVTDAGRLAVAVPGAGPQPVPQASLDEAERLGWIDLTGAEPRLTDRGTYWVDKWARKHHRGRR